MVATLADARGVNLHVYVLGLDGGASPDVTLELGTVRRCSGRLADAPAVTAGQHFGAGELLVIDQTTLRFVIGARTVWERKVPGNVAYHGGAVVAVERPRGFDLLWLDEKTGATTRTVELREAPFTPPAWCGDRVLSTYRSTAGQAGAVCLVLD